MKLNLKNKKKSIRKICEINTNFLIEKMTNYFEVLEIKGLNISPVLLAIDIVNQWKNKGLINEFGYLNSVGAQIIN